MSGYIRVALAALGRAIVKSCVWADHAAARSWRSPSTNLTPRMNSARWCGTACNVDPGCGVIGVQL